MYGTPRRESTMTQAISGALAPQTITVDATAIVLPASTHPNVEVYYIFTLADDDDVELTRSATETALIPIVGAKNGGSGERNSQIEGPFRLGSANLPRFVHLGSASTIRVTVLMAE